MKAVIAHDAEEEIYPLSHGNLSLIEDCSSDDSKGLMAFLAHVSLQSGTGQPASDKLITATVRTMDRYAGIKEGNLITPLHTRVSLLVVSMVAPVYEFLKIACILFAGPGSSFSGLIVMI